PGATNPKRHQNKADESGYHADDVVDCTERRTRVVERGIQFEDLLVQIASDFRLTPSTEVRAFRTRFKAGEGGIGDAFGVKRPDIFWVFLQHQIGFGDRNIDRVAQALLFRRIDDIA